MCRLDSNNAGCPVRSDAGITAGRHEDAPLDDSYSCPPDRDNLLRRDDVLDGLVPIQDGLPGVAAR